MVVPQKFGSGKLPPDGSGKAEQMKRCLWGAHLKAWVALRWKGTGEEGKGVSTYT